MIKPPGEFLYPPLPVVIADDEEQALISCQIVLRTNGINNVKTLADSREVMPLLTREKVSAVMLDLSMPHLSGQDLLKRIRMEFSQVPVIIVTGHNDLETAVNCMREGAFDYFVKPVDRNRLVAALQRAIQFRELERENELLKQHLLSGQMKHPDAFEGIITINPRMKSLFAYIEAIAPSMQPVLVMGETGAGKELFARAIHHASQRSGQFVPINVAGLDDTVFSDTLFGHKRGAFTGAEGVRKGLVETAANGTLFLDEIGDLPMPSQVKLLRLLQEREYYPLGSDVPKRADVRFVVATNQDLDALMKEGKFRRDLYYRLQTHKVGIPPLRDRKEDLTILVQHFVNQACKALGKKPPKVPAELQTLLSVYHFPGNIRELEAIVFDAISKNEAKILSLQVFKERVFGRSDVSDDNLRLPEETELPPVTFGDKLPTLKQAADLLTDEALRRSQGNQTIAAHMLGITQQALSKRMKARQNGGSEE